MQRSDHLLGWRSVKSCLDFDYLLTWQGLLGLEQLVLEQQERQEQVQQGLGQQEQLGLQQVRQEREQGQQERQQEQLEQGQVRQGQRRVQQQEQQERLQELHLESCR